jgi:hypothetical protein
VTGVYDRTNSVDGIVADAVYLGGSDYGMQSLALNRPWGVQALYASGTQNALVTQFEVLDGQPGCIGWALAQPDGAVVSLQCESIVGASDGGRMLALREWYEPESETPRLVLALPWATALEEWNQVDIVSGTLATLQSGQRIITNPLVVERRVGPNGLPNILVPKAYADDGEPEVWPWRELVYQRQ